MRDGAVDFLEKPFSAAVLIHRAGRAFECTRIAARDVALDTSDRNTALKGAVPGVSYWLRLRCRTDSDSCLPEH